MISDLHSPLDNPPAGASGIMETALNAALVTTSNSPPVSTAMRRGKRKRTGASMQDSVFASNFPDHSGIGDRISRSSCRGRWEPIGRLSGQHTFPARA